MVMNIKNLVNISVWVALLQCVGFGLGQITQSNISWYNSLYKSSLTPTSVVFSTVWAILYVVIAVVGHYLWCYRDEPKARKVWNLYTIQLLLNWSWSIVFFAFHLVLLAFLLIVVMIGINIKIVLMTKKNYYFAANMMIPYIIWLVFAGYLNFVILRLN